jgi:hypothetical protein
LRCGAVNRARKIYICDLLPRMKAEQGLKRWMGEYPFGLSSAASMYICC